MDWRLLNPMLTKLIFSLCFLGAYCLGTVLASERPPSPLVEFWSIPKKHTELSSHPRLVISQEDLNRLSVRIKKASPNFYPDIVAAAELGLEDAGSPLEQFWFGQRSMMMNGRLLSLVIQWHLTGERKYLESAIENVKYFEKYAAYGTGFELWDGTGAMAVALTYDLLYKDLRQEEKEFLQGLGRAFVQNWLRSTGKGDQKEQGETTAFWVRRASNWNPVCSAGPGMLALTMYEELPEAQLVLDRVFYTFRPLFEEMKKNDGAWVEGLGYWNWTIARICMFGVSYERATGKPYEDFRSKEFRKGLMSGTWFAPHQIGCGFGDNQSVRLSPVFSLASKHLGYEEEYRFHRWYRQRIEEIPNIKENKDANIFSARPLSMLMLDSERPAKPPLMKRVSKHYPHQGWGFLADQWPEPQIYASVRGGVMTGDHTHADLLSWHGVINGERMITNITKSIGEPTGYYNRKYDVFEISQASKNTLFIAGISAYTGEHPRYGLPSVETQSFSLASGPALLMDARNVFVYSGSRRRPTMVKRLFTVLGSEALLVIDRVTSRISVPVEARAFTQQKATFGDVDVLLEGETQTARMTFASNRPTVLREAVALSTYGKTEPPTMIRFQTSKKANSIVLASLLSAGSGSVELEVVEKEDRVQVRASHQNWKHLLELSLGLSRLQ